jgi:hypothetical protein
MEQPNRAKCSEPEAVIRGRFIKNNPQAGSDRKSGDSPGEFLGGNPG